MLSTITVVFVGCCKALYTMYREPAKAFWAVGHIENSQEWRAAFCGASEAASRLWATNFQSADASPQKGNKQLLHQAAGPVILQ